MLFCSTYVIINKQINGCTQTLYSSESAAICLYPRFVERSEAYLRDHLAVGCEILDLVAQVRILVPQPFQVRKQEFMPTNILEWSALFLVNVVAGVVAGFLAKRVPKLVGLLLLLSIVNPIIIYYGTAILQGGPMDEYHAWALLIIPMLSGLGFPVLLVSAIVCYLLNKRMKKRRETEETIAS